MVARIVSNTTAASVTQVRLRVSSVATINPKASVAYSTALADISYIELVVGAYLDTTGRFRFIAEITTTLDAKAIALAKRLRSTGTATDSVASSVSKSLSDSVLPVDSSTLIDGIEYGLQKRSVDSVTVADGSGLSFSKSRADVASALDSSSRQFGKRQSESLSATDALSKSTSFSRPINDPAPAIDLRSGAISLLEPVGDQRYFVAGYVVSGYAASDSAFTSDSVLLSVQTYASGDYFLESYVGATYGPF